MNLLKRSKDPCPSYNGRWANTTSWTCDQSESRTVGNSSCCWNIYPTRKLEIKGLFWFVVRICQSELILEIWHFSNSDIGWRKIKYTYCSIVTKLWRYFGRRTRTWRNTKIARRSSQPITERPTTIWYQLLDFNWKMFKSKHSSKCENSSSSRPVFFSLFHLPQS